MAKSNTELPEIHVQDYEVNTPVATIEDIRKHNPHRFEFEMITAITQIDPARHLIVGYKDMKDDDFWTRGHMPGQPLFPGVLMCEAAAQLCAYYGSSQGITTGMLLGLGGIEMAKFKRIVKPGERLIMIGHGLRVDRRLMRFRIVGFVGTEMTYETIVVGVPLKL